MANMIRRPWVQVLALAVVAVSATVLITSVTSVEARDPSRPSAWIHTSPVYVKADHTAQLAVFNSSTTGGVVHFSFFSALSGELINESGPVDLPSHTGATYELPFPVGHEILGLIHFESDQVSPDVSADSESDHGSVLESDDANDQRPRRRHPHRKRRIRLPASLQVFDEFRQTDVYHALGR